jgi:HD-like signal output (HDOD) protein
VDDEVEKPAGFSLEFVGLNVRGGRHRVAISSKASGKRDGIPFFNFTASIKTSRRTWGRTPRLSIKSSVAHIPMTPQLEESAERAVILGSLPVFPAVALELIELVDRGVAGAAAIARLLERDPALSAEALRQANSVRYARRHDVREVADAVTLLGTDDTCRIAMRAACKGLIVPALGRPELRSCWEHCVASAILAAALAPVFDQAPGPAYTAGLLHDIGCLALVAVYPDRYIEMLELMRQGESGWMEAERRTFGVTHCSVGRWVVEEWGLPDDLRDIVFHHHDDRPFDRSLLTLVATASRLADLVQPHPIEQLAWDDPAAYIATLPFDDPGEVMRAVHKATERIKEEL